MSAFDARHVLHSEESYRIQLRGFFYLLQAAQSDISAMRTGMCFLGDCGNCTLRNFDLQLEQRAAQLSSHAYPIRMIHMVILQAPIVVRFFYAVAKALFLSKKMRQCVTVTARRQGWLELHQAQYPPSVLPVAWGGTVNSESTGNVILHYVQRREYNARHYQLPP